MDEIAIVGMGLAVPGANSPAEFWRVRGTGAELFVPPPADRWNRAAFIADDPGAEDKSYQDRFGFLTGFRPEPQAADACAGMEMTTAWLRHSMTQALRGVRRDANDRVVFPVAYTPDGNLDLEQTEVVASMLDRLTGAMAADGVPAARREEVSAAAAAVLGDHFPRATTDPARLFPDRVARIAMAGLLPDDTDVRTVDTACSSGLYAIAMGMLSLRLGRCDLAVCGSSFAFTARSTVMFAKLGGLSRRGEVRSYDDTADGVLFGDGAGVVVLKTLRRALDDGDEVLAVLTSAGMSSDGRGTAIYAPNGNGQDIAVARALAGPVGAADIDWVIGHGTGTPTGDDVELRTIGRHYTNVHVSSNKSLIGHLAWSAGMVSVIEAVLGLRHERIPAQIRFTAPRSAAELDEAGIRIPPEAVPWPPRAGRPRAAAVSAFGFGGTNAHVVVREHAPNERPGAAPTARARDRRAVIVGWSALLPGLADRAATVDWIRGTGDDPAASFGADYPMPPFQQVRLPPGTIRMMDRTQLMAMQCAHDLSTRLSGLWEDHASDAGVFVGHSGPTRVAMLIANRIYLDDVVDTLRSDSRTATLPETTGGLAGLNEDVRGAIRPVNEDSYPGTMPNIIAARVANRFDLHGPNIALDAGMASGLAAIDTAALYVRTGELDLALVTGVHGNTLPEFAAGHGRTGADLAEGAVMFAVTTEDLAARYELPILAHVGDLVTSANQADQADDAVTIECAPRFSRYLGASGALGVLAALHRPPGRVSVRCSDPATRLDLTIPERSPAEPTEQLVRRNAVRLRPAPAEPVRDRVPFLPSGLVLLTDHPGLAAALPLPPDATVLSTAAAPDRPDWMVMPVPEPEAISKWLAARHEPVRHVRILTRLAESDALLALHDAAFLVTQMSAASLAEPGSSVIALLLGGHTGGTVAAPVGLFTGLIKVVGLELAGCRAFALATTSADPAVGIRQADAEGGLRRTFPVVHYDGDTRLVPGLVEVPIEPGGSELTAESVVVAVGGARGITAEVTKEIARRYRCRIYVLGSGRLTDEDSREWAAAGGSRSAFIRRRLAGDRSVPVPALNREFDRLANAESTRDTVARLAESCGADRVRYLSCDVTDADAVQAAVDEILAASASVDLLVHAAGRNRSAPIADKRFAEFTAIRDVKVKGYWNLKRAFGDRQPRIWCNFGSLIGYFGQLGEADYASGNDFLASAATAAAAEGAREYTIDWTMWTGAGMAGSSGDLADSYFRRTALYTAMSSAEGVQYFLSELRAANTEPVVLTMGAADQHTFGQLHPGHLVGQGRPRGRFYLPDGQPTAEQAVTFDVVFDLAVDGYLRDHLVRGVPTLPGAFVTEIAAEAAGRLVPNGKVIAFVDSRFERFVHVHPDRGRVSKRVKATVLGETDGVTEVDVVISEDVRSPGGVLLVRDRTHFRTRVLLAGKHPDPPQWLPWSDAVADTAVTEPLAAGDTTIALTGPFHCLADIRGSACRTRATYRFAERADHPLADSLLMPVFLIDGLARVGLAAGSDGAVRTPTGVARIDLYAEGNDWDLRTLHGELALYAQDDRMVALAPDGQVVAGISGVDSAVLRW
ncbi:hypothetical protein ALI144C_19400 [Actinosynnema sp. ALI-1.44]|uniref:SDR family oxidoreductase n=1 Tax=Actinosynnema sp. ALI-1.44 TaxID=1933779 RepID=UPI00097C103E|nr:SDR family oxidoreductase [Actinosynnema sp. ALI-1.44]ONI81490.1 hypothetical protein ALI144C_19400 [Actinosynnema sp. ALI-1.44]